MKYRYLLALRVEFERSVDAENSSDMNEELALRNRKDSIVLRSFAAILEELRDFVRKSWIGFELQLVSSETLLKVSEIKSFDTISKSMSIIFSKFQKTFLQSLKVSPE